MMRRDAGTTLLELMIYLSLTTIGLSAGLSLYHAERFSGQEAERAFSEARAASAVLYRLTGDLRDTERAVPRAEGPGVLLFRPDGTVVVWFDRSGSAGEVHRKVLDPEGRVLAREVVARGVSALTVRTEGRLFVARAVAGRQDREVVVRSRHAK